MRARTVSLRLLALALLALWTSLAIAVLVGYRPGGPGDIAVASAAFLPSLIAASAVVWPPAVSGDRASLAVAWLGITSALLVLPLLGDFAGTLAAGGRQTLLPSAEVAYAAVLALGSTCLYAGLGMSRALLRQPRLTRARLALGGGLAVAGTAIGAGIFGTATLANELALRERPPSAVGSIWGPSDLSLTPPACAAGPAVGSAARVSITGEATIDGAGLGRVALEGARNGRDERWTADLASSFAVSTAAYVRIGADAWLQRDRGAWEPTRLGLEETLIERPSSTPPPLPAAGTLDAAARAAIRGEGDAPVAEDLGVELIEGVKARHCRTATDGPIALAMFVPLRWLAARDLTVPPPTLAEWRGDIDWWVFADGELGLATIAVSGYPGELWPTAGLQATLSARLTALERGAPQRIDPVP